MKKQHLIITGAAAVIIFFSIKTYDDYREKSLDDVMAYDTSEVDSLVMNHELITDNERHAEELSAYLSQYQVRKMRNRDWDPDVSGTKGFDVSINGEDGTLAWAGIYEDRLHLYSRSAYYEILNGPIDMGWVGRFIEDIQEASD
ncbi:hypothetical protein [Alteribacter natronophilus]|uniref:hypothetical protein n=1 Tax=Alteribacter natronophilus TaxID=2583810 RepID=UPI00110F62F2|nr:hypothetical protein [Alteribacter natronophilus]TMW71041.1 hypothetical protein FGB90_13815 [Alteribacter natronophilus]